MIWTRVFLFSIILLHFFVVIVNAIAFFVLPFTWLILNIPFWYSVLLITPIESLILYLSFNRQPCPLTLWENSCRKQLGMAPIGGFIGHYVIKQRWRNKKTKIEKQ